MNTLEPQGFHPKTKHIAICVYDSGIGIYNSLKHSKHHPQTEIDAITLAIQEGIGDGKGQGKLTQNPQLAWRLVETGSRPLLEGNHWSDAYWGIDLRTREGENHLGELLMELWERSQQKGILKEPERSPDCWFGPVDGITLTGADLTLLDVQCIVAAADKTL